MPRPELRSPLAVVCHDAGACNVILPWLERSGLTLRPLMQGPAAQIFAERARRRPCLAAARAATSLQEALEGAAMLLSGSGWASDLEHEARRLARERGLFSVAVIDHWINYKPRFEREGEVVWPDEFWVSDNEALALAKQAFPGAVVRRFDNLYLREAVETISPRPRRPSQLLYVLEPARDDWGRGVPGEFQALDHFMALRKTAAALPPNAPIRLRPHPSDAPGKYDAWIAAQQGEGADVALDTHGTLAEALSDSAWVVGCESFALVVALAAGRRVWTSLPPWAPRCRLPHVGITALGVPRLIDAPATKRVARVS